MTKTTNDWRQNVKIRIIFNPKVIAHTPNCCNLTTHNQNNLITTHKLGFNTTVHWLLFLLKYFTSDHQVVTNQPHAVSGQSSVTISQLKYMGATECRAWLRAETFNRLQNYVYSRSGPKPCELEMSQIRKI